MNQFFSVDVPAFTDALAGLESRLTPTAEPHGRQLSCAGGGVRGLVQCLPSHGGVVGRRYRAAHADKGTLPRADRPWLDRSWTCGRALTKPRGYPGDYELLTALYDNLPKGRGLAGYIDLYLLNITLTTAIRERLLCAKTFLTEELSRRRGDVSILNVACGCVREYEGGIEHPDGANVRITCVDTDRETLDYVKRRSASPAMRKLRIDCVAYNAIRTSSAHGNIRRFGRPDILYSIGLCDYIPDRHLVPMLQGWRETVNDDGVVYVAFKDIRRYSPTIYQRHMDW